MGPGLRQTRWRTSFGHEYGAGEAKSYLDDMAQKYASNAGIDLSSGPAAGDSSGGGMMMDPAAIEELTKDQKHLFKQQLELFARYLKMDLRDGDTAAIVSKENEAALQAQLD